MSDAMFFGSILVPTILLVWYLHREDKRARAREALRKRLLR